MTDHLPECPWLLYSPAPCICDRLRKAEQRGFDNGRESITDEDRQNIHRIRQQGYAAGLTAARDAVAALVPDGIAPGLLAPLYARGVGNALAAIDALRNPGLADLSGIPEEDFR